MGKITSCLSIMMSSCLLATSAHAIVEKNVTQPKPQSHSMITPPAVSKALTEVQLRRLKSALQNQKAYGSDIDQVLDRIELLQNQLRSER